MPELGSSPETEFNTVQREVMHSKGSGGNSDSKPEFKAAVGLSREWDARKAGREVARDTLEKLGKDPDFFLLFSTIHYEKWGGFQEFLDGVWDVLPKGTPLIGGTVTGFICPQGCYTRGATAMAVSYPNMDVAVGIGRNTKRNPKSAARWCAGMIKDGLKNSKYENKFLFEVISGPTIPKLSWFNKKIIKSKILEGLIPSLFYISEKLLQKGVGREEEVLDELTKDMSEYSLIGGSTYDDNKMTKNYQFYNKEVLTNSIVSVGLSSQLKSSINVTHGLKEMNRKFRVTNLRGENRIIHKIDNKSATDEFLKALTWPSEYLDERAYLKTYFTPLGFKKNGVLFPEIIGYFIGGSIICGYKIEDNDLYILSASGKSLMNAIDENLSAIKGKDNLMALGISCAIMLQTLGSNVFHIQKKLLEVFRESPFLFLYGAGVDSYTPQKGAQHINMALNMGILHRK